MADRPSRRQAKKSLDLQRIKTREQERSKIREIRKILKKAKWDITEDECKILEEHSNVVQEVQKRIARLQSLTERSKEVLDPPLVLETKCRELADAIKSANSVVVYTGAGISTAAQIPDYRGPDGVWTKLQKGQQIEVQDLSVAEPTFTHMALKQMHKLGLITHILSQNCDGLHLRSGLRQSALSEVHGNMFIEVCPKCKPFKQYIRLFDVTENTSFHRHNTGRFCKRCQTELKDTIVHFGETGTFPWPLNWKGAAKAASKADLILCLGSSLKVLKRYKCLWGLNRSPNKRPKVYIVNLQWTPKDSHCTLKINGNCDSMMMLLTMMLNVEVPQYQKNEDPLLHIAMPLTPEEKGTTSRLDVQCHIPTDELDIDSCDSDIKNNIEHLLNCVTETLAGSSEHCDLEYVKEETGTIELNEPVCSEETDKQSKGSNSASISGWYGKGYAKIWKKSKRRKL